MSHHDHIPFPRRRLHGLLAVAAAILAIAAAPVAAAQADPTYGVMNANGGTYWRSAPDWNTPVAVAGFGFYPGTVIEVHCYQAGAGNVPGSADDMWENATDVGGSGYGSGWVNEHFINDGQPINQPSPGVPPCQSAPPPPSAPPSGGLVFSIFNAEGGIYYRYGPHWGETTATPGVGVYNGDRVELICGAFGDAVGPYADTAWSKVRNLSRPVGEGWVNEHYINDGAADNGFVPGEPMCQPGASGAGGNSTGAGGTTGPRALYYSPYGENPHGPGSTGQIKLDNGQWVSAPAPRGTTTLSRNQWDKADAAHCPDPKYSQPSSTGITTLAAWSEAHAAPFLLLQSSTAWRSRIHYILLFDPGTQAELDGSPCDRKYQMGLILQKWLTSNPNNRFVILSAKVTADKEHSTELGLGHAGIQDTFFTPLKVLGDKPGQAPRTQIVVCNYDTMSHEEVWRRYSAWIVKPPITLGTCPPWPGHKVVAWNP